jgi:nitronate monooxygenase
MWLKTDITELLGIEHPLLLAPMAGVGTPELAIAVAEAGGLGSLACAMLTPEQIRRDLQIIRQRTNRPINLNFFVHTPPVPDAASEVRWSARLEHKIDRSAPVPTSNRAPFSAETCAIVEEFRPEVVSFHFGLPDEVLLSRVKATGARILSSATTVAEARWLEARGCDAIIAQGYEAGGHRGLFLTDDTNAIANQPGTFALVPQVADAVRVPVIAAGGIADARGIAAAFALGASAVQIGTAYMVCPEAGTSAAHRKLLMASTDDGTALTNLFTGRPARGIVNRVMREIGPMSAEAPAFPLAGGALMPLKAAAEAQGRTDFTTLWSGQAGALAQEMPAGELTRQLARQAMEKLRRATS